MRFVLGFPLVPFSNIMDSILTYLLNLRIHILAAELLTHTTMKTKPINKSTILVSNSIFILNLCYSNFSVSWGSSDVGSNVETHNSHLFLWKKHNCIIQTGEEISRQGAGCMALWEKVQNWERMNNSVQAFYKEKSPTGTGVKRAFVQCKILKRQQEVAWSCEMAGAGLGVSFTRRLQEVTKAGNKAQKLLALNHTSSGVQVSFLGSS